MAAAAAAAAAAVVVVAVNVKSLQTFEQHFKVGHGRFHGISSEHLSYRQPRSVSNKQTKRSNEHNGMFYSCQPCRCDSRADEEFRLLGYDAV
jgi:hypothetical protein